LLFVVGGENMQLDAAQKRVVQSKFLGHSLVRGITETGKTTIAVNRSIYLKNNYCLYETDKILMIAQNDKHLEHIERIHDKVGKETQLEYMTLFSNAVDKVRLTTIDSIIYSYFSEYERSNKMNYEVTANGHKQSNIVNKCIVQVKKLYKDVKILNTKHINFFIDEINWIKDCNYTQLQSYQNSDRIGRKTKKGEGPQRLLKNSKAREAIFEIFTLYNEELKKQNLIDSKDIIILALKQLKRSENSKYTHIIVDDSHNLTKLQLDFVNELSSKKTYSSLMLFANKDNQLDCNGWIIKGRKANSLELGDKIKSYSLKKKHIDIIENKDPIINIEDQGGNCTNDVKNNFKNLLSIENFKYRDIRHNRKYEFIRDLNNASEIIVKNEDREDEYTNEELRQLPVYSDIAAGEPILINPNLEGNFQLPKYWLKGIKDCFILKVKGDSMIGADIYDGDYVVIRKQHMAQNNDIVAVDLDGSATLKRLVMNKSGVVLMPENEKYNPIPIVDDEASIIGVAIGVINRIN
jgi:SOS regulatory protein LexA